jgi:hypothetical protein
MTSLDEVFRKNADGVSMFDDGEATPTPTQSLGAAVAASA